MFSIKNVIQWWDNFFFRPEPVESIALFRVFWCLMLFVNMVLDFANIHDFYGEHAILSLSTVKSQFPYSHLNIFHFFHTGTDFVYYFFGVYAISLLFGILGFYTRTSLCVAFICLVSLHQRNIWLLSSSELLMRLTMILLICSPCGHAFSIDSLLLRGGSKPKVRDWSPWACRLIQIQLAVVYVWTVWHKLKGDTWFDGTALYYASRLDAMKNYPVPYLLDWLPSIRLMTWGTLILELALGLLIWFKEFRKPLIILGVFFHLSIEYMMSIPYFEIVMILLLLTFVDPAVVRRFMLDKRNSWATWIQNSKARLWGKEQLIWVIKPGP